MDGGSEIISGGVAEWKGIIVESEGLWRLRRVIMRFVIEREGLMELDE